MKKQIFRSICGVAAGILLASLLLIMGVLYTYFSSIQMKNLEAETAIAAAAVEEMGENYLRNIEDSDTRVTWIAADGSILFDNKANSAEMENHMERDEVRDALQTGTGRSARYSTTLTKRQLYFAKRLSDGSVLRLSSVHLTWWALLFGMLQPILFVVILAVGLSLFLAYRLSERIVKPLNEVNLAAPDSEQVYEELSPLLEQIKAQQNQLRVQEIALKRKNREFDMATENMREGILLLGEDGNVLSVNKAASGILKIDRHCIGSQLRLPENMSAIRELLQIAGSGKNVEETIAIDGGEYRFHASPIITDENVSGIALILFDITDKEKAEASRREFTANVSHELKTPLQTISGCAELLAGGMVKPEDVPKFAENIYTESRRMISLIEDIIKLSHLDEASDSYRFEKTDVYALAMRTCQNLLPVAEGQGVSLTVTGEKTEISAIPSLLSEILYNLCDNAIKYNQKGGSVTVSAENSGDAVVLTVRDTGIGIPQEEQERIFERFYRVDKSRSKEVGGTGLGLSIVKHAAGIHGAEVKMTSKVGSGTTFTLRFPKEIEGHNEIQPAADEDCNGLWE